MPGLRSGKKPAGAAIVVAAGTMEVVERTVEVTLTTSVNVVAEGVMVVVSWVVLVMVKLLVVNEKTYDVSILAPVGAGNSL